MLESLVTNLLTSVSGFFGGHRIYIHPREKGKQIPGFSTEGWVYMVLVTGPGDLACHCSHVCVLIIPHPKKPEM
jgi:hypothetical protein